MRRQGHLANGQTYYKCEKRQGMNNLPARMPSKKQRRRWRRMMKRMHLTAEEYQRMLSVHRWWKIRYSGQR